MWRLRRDGLGVGWCKRGVVCYGGVGVGGGLGAVMAVMREWWYWCSDVGVVV